MSISQDERGRAIFERGDFLNNIRAFPPYRKMHALIQVTVNKTRIL